MAPITISICQSNYIPWRGYFDLIAYSDYFVILDSVQYTKNDWRNRNIVKNQELSQWITIPCKIGTLNQKINETQIAQTDWYIKHLKTLKNNYYRSKHFKLVYPWLEDIYNDKLASLKYLSDVNYILLIMICEFLEIKTKIIRDSELELKGDKNEKLIHICKQLQAKNYLSGPAAKSYLNENLFLQNNINVDWMDYNNYKIYDQLHGKFDPYLSIIDLLFNEGVNAKFYLKSNQNR